eukprot:3446410-Rhodomonas_salina.1
MASTVSARCGAAGAPKKACRSSTKVSVSAVDSFSPVNTSVTPVKPRVKPVKPVKPSVSSSSTATAA